MMAGRELRAVNRGSLLGLGWLILKPLMQVSIYVVIIGYVFALRLPETSGNFGYVLHILSGLFVWQFMQRIFEEAPSLVRDRTEFLRQVVYPLETLPVTSVIMQLPALGAGVFVFTIVAAFDAVLSPYILLFPIALGFFLMFLLGSAWILMVVGMFFRDMKDIINIIMGVLFYVSPVLLDETMVKPEVWAWVTLSPFAHVIISMRDGLYGTFHAESWVIFSGMSVTLFFIGAISVQYFKSKIQNYY